MESLNESNKRAIFAKIVQCIDTRYVSSNGVAPDTARLRAEHEHSVVTSTTVEEFEHLVNRALKDLGPGHVGFFHETSPRLGPRIATAATFATVSTSDGPRWMFQDVHAGGPAASAGIQPGDVLLQIDAKELIPPEPTVFSVDRSYTLTIRKSDGTTTQKILEIPRPGTKGKPVIVPAQVVTASRLDPDVGMIRISMFPGTLGMDVARDMTRAVRELGCSRLIVDLRGNSGGGIGCLRLMSQLCADRRGVGYSLEKRALQNGQAKEQLPQFDRIPSSTLGLIPLIVRFGTGGLSIAVFTESLGAQAYHGRVALLVNEHSASAAELVAAFASEYGLATLIGVKTAGRVAAASPMKVGFGYRVALPVAAYRTWRDQSLDGNGVPPHVEIPLLPEALWRGEDPQLTQARAVVRSS
jgi:carboxyl-terminal processing protease